MTGTFATLISVVITCFNLERYIAQAIHSVLEQRDVEDFEVIVVDDCSTDESAEKIRQFERVRYLRTERNGGVLNAMVAGVEAARGDLVCLLDGDDVWRPDKLAQVRAAFADPAVALVTHNLGFIDSTGAAIEKDSRPHQVLGKLEGSARGERVRQGILELGDYVWLGSALSFRRSAIDWPGFARFAQGLPDPANTYQDWPLAFWIAAQPAARMAYIDEQLFSYRLHGANHSGDARTVERAVRNFTRTLNTTEAMGRIADDAGLGPEVRLGIERRIAAVRYMIDLNRGRRARALLGLLRSSGELRRRRVLLKEVARFVGVQLLGADRFGRMAAQRKSFRNLPVS